MSTCMWLDSLQTPVTPRDCKVRISSSDTAGWNMGAQIWGTSVKISVSQEPWIPLASTANTFLNSWPLDLPVPNAEYAKYCDPTHSGPILLTRSLEMYERSAPVSKRMLASTAPVRPATNTVLTCSLIDTLLEVTCVAETMDDSGWASLGDGAGGLDGDAGGCVGAGVLNLVPDGDCVCETVPLNLHNNTLCLPWQRTHFLLQFLLMWPLFKHLKQRPALLIFSCLSSNETCVKFQHFSVGWPLWQMLHWLLTDSLRVCNAAAVAACGFLFSSATTGERNSRNVCDRSRRWISNFKNDSKNSRSLSWPAPLRAHWGEDQAVNDSISKGLKSRRKCHQWYYMSPGCGRETKVHLRPCEGLIHCTWMGQTNSWDLGYERKQFVLCGQSDPPTSHMQSHNFHLSKLTPLLNPTPHPTADCADKWI